MRIDDADTPRIAKGATDSILRTLERFALHWDGEPVLQSSVTVAYLEALAYLDSIGSLYPCSCSRKALTSLPTVNGSGRKLYSGVCRYALRPRSQSHSLRVITDNAHVTWHDNLQGPQYWDIPQEFGDFIVMRRDGIISYHLATVIDDWQAGVTEVLRGYDLLESTPLQIHLQTLLGLPGHSYLHIPIVVDKHGVKLSKQNKAEAVDDRNPSFTLFRILSLLRQSPPEELISAPPKEILAWAIEAWDITKLSGMTAVDCETNHQ